MYIRTKRNKSGTISVVVVDKSSGKYREIETIGIAKNEGEVNALMERGRQWIVEREERMRPTLDFGGRAEAAKRRRERREVGVWSRASRTSFSMAASWCWTMCSTWWGSTPLTTRCSANWFTTS